MENQNNSFLIYSAPNNLVRVDVYMQDETVWLTQKSLAELFDTSTQNITIHLKNIYEDPELQEEATCKEFLQVQLEGKREVARKTKFYNLDAIISVGYSGPDEFTQQLISDFDKEIKKLGNKK